MKITVQELENLKIPNLQLVEGLPLTEGYRPWPPENAPPGAIVFASTPEQVDMALEAPAGIIIALNKALTTKIKLQSHQALFSTSSIPQSMAHICKIFDQKKARWAKGIHPTAIIDPSAQVPKTCDIGAYVVIGPNVYLGENTILGPHVIIERGSHIGSNCHLHGHVFIGENTDLGNFVEIHPHTTLGSDGFGYHKSGSNLPLKISQLGKVVIEDFVEIGANCAIDRATLTETRIGAGTKLDNLIHIAHNFKIGKNSFLTAGFMTAGSVEIGDNFTSGGMVGVVDHIKITDNVTIGGRSTVTKDIPASGAYTGYPIEPWRDGLKTLALLPNLTEMKKQIIEIRKKLGLEKNQPT